MGGGFLWGAFAHAFLCLTVVLLNNPNPVQYPLDYKCGLGLVGYTGTALTTQLVLTPVQHPRMGLKTSATDALPVTDL